eukprot:evm.model.scf_925.5 EVM.evm.TU.scf_925.5   scf_925:43509-45314(+)
MVQADAVREARLAAVAEKARNKVQHAKHISKMRRLNDKSRSETRRHYINCKLQEAADRRKECYSVKTGAIPKVGKWWNPLVGHCHQPPLWLSASFGVMCLGNCVHNSAAGKI